MKQHKQFTIVGNWKMNPGTLDEAKKIRTRYRALDKKYPNIALLYAPPTPFLAPLAPRKDESLEMVAQNIFYEEQGAYTGASSVEMVHSVGATSVLIGHSERRALFGVDEEKIAQKISRAISAGMPMIVCIGESNRDTTGKYVDTLEEQLDTVLAPFLKHKGTLQLLTIAYEPIWAVGEHSSRAMTADELFSTYLLLEKIMSKHMSVARAKRVPILYGGSVNASNIQEIASVRGISGVLVGRASRDIKELSAMCERMNTR